MNPKVKAHEYLIELDISEQLKKGSFDVGKAIQEAYIAGWIDRTMEEISMLKF